MRSVRSVMSLISARPRLLKFALLLLASAAASCQHPGALTAASSTLQVAAGGDVGRTINDAIASCQNRTAECVINVPPGDYKGASSVKINTPLKLNLGSGTYSWSGPDPLFTIASTGVTIEGSGRTPGATVLNAPAGATAIYIAAGALDTVIRHLYISGPNANSSPICKGSGSAKGGWAIQVASNFPSGPNSVFFLEDIQISGGYGGVQAINPINSSLKDVRIGCTASDGFSFIGSGTTVTCVNCYVTAAGRNGFAVSGLANVTLVGGETELSGSDGVFANSNTNGNATIGLTVTGLDVEANAGSGIHTDGASGTSVSGSSIINNHGDGLRISGGVGFVMTGGRLGGNAGYGMNAGVLSTKGYPSQDLAVFSPLAQFPGNGSGFLNDPHHQVLSYSRAALGLAGVTWTTGSGQPSSPCSTGSLYTNQSGAAGSTLYVCTASGWVAK